MRVMTPAGEETEATVVWSGDVDVLGVGRVKAREFWASYTPQPNRRDGERRQVRERRKHEGLARRSGKPRRRMDALTHAERELLPWGAEHLV